MKIRPASRRSLIVPVLIILLGLGLVALLSSCDPAAEAAQVAASTSPPPSSGSSSGSGSGQGTGGNVTAACATSAQGCSPQGFAAALFSYIGAPDTAANEFAMQAWERAEGGAFANSAHCNPLNTTLKEPGSTPINNLGNGVAVQAYANAGGQTCWQWGIRANGDTIDQSNFSGILARLKNPSSSTATQCQQLTAVVSAEGWGTADFSSLC